ncbi:MAG: 2-amino-4-hydroxy-6-hydroxymethyldihydropteridine diphosphokinase [Actinomycetaceae bacterium]|nr:2-amino-4-hydroxy-6-hydroxymethyldihydropteridine diphosphokinase [Actinomycetaceae bacterium]
MLTSGNPPVQGLDYIRFSGLRAYGKHGVYDEERENGQLFIIDADIFTDTRDAAASGDLCDTFDYSKVVQVAKNVIEGATHHLIEELAQKIADDLLCLDRVEAVRLCLHKPEAPIDAQFDDVSVTIWRGKAFDRSCGEEKHEVALAVETDGQASDIEQDNQVTHGINPGDAQVFTEVDEGKIHERAALPDGGAGESVRAVHSASDYEAVLRGADGGIDDVPSAPLSVVIALGANLGEPIKTLRKAIADISQLEGVGLESVGTLIRTEPVVKQQQDAQPDYFNTVIGIQSVLSPRQLFHRLQDIEQKYGRERKERWGARTIDIDLIDIKGIVSEDPELTIPHPRAHERAFVLMPWTAIEPNARLGAHGEIITLCEHADDRRGIKEMWEYWYGSDVDKDVPAPSTGTGALPLPQWLNVSARKEVRIVDDPDAVSQVHTIQNVPEILKRRGWREASARHAGNGSAPGDSRVQSLIEGVPTVSSAPMSPSTPSASDLPHGNAKQASAAQVAMMQGNIPQGQSGAAGVPLASAVNVAGQPQVAHDATTPPPFPVLSSSTDQQKKKVSVWRRFLAWLSLAPSEYNEAYPLSAPGGDNHFQHSSAPQWPTINEHNASAPATAQTPVAIFDEDDGEDRTRPVSRIEDDSAATEGSDDNCETAPIAAPLPTTVTRTPIIHGRSRKQNHLQQSNLHQSGGQQANAAQGGSPRRGTSNDGDPTQVSTSQVQAEGGDMDRTDTDDADLGDSQSGRSQREQDPAVAQAQRIAQNVSDVKSQIVRPTTTGSIPVVKS